jgi:hypothetical protein
MWNSEICGAKDKITADDGNAEKRSWGYSDDRQGGII